MGYALVTIPQLTRADQELWRLVTSATRAGVAPLPNGIRLVERAMRELSNDTDLSKTYTVSPRVCIVVGLFVL